VSGTVRLEIPTTSSMWQIPYWQYVVEFCNLNVWSFYKHGAAGVLPHGAPSVFCPVIL